MSASINGQLWFTTSGGGSQTRIVRVNSDGTSQTINTDNTGGGIPSTAPSSGGGTVGLKIVDVAVDTASGVYFILVTDPYDSNAQILRGTIGSSAAPTSVTTYPSTDLVSSIQIDAVNRKLYVGYEEGNGTAASSGIKSYNYNAAGTLSGETFIVTAQSDNRADEGGISILMPRDFAIDPTVGSAGRLFYTELLDGGAQSQGLFRVDLSAPTVATQMVIQTQFPDEGTNGYIHDVEVDPATDLVYFTTQGNASQTAIWYVSENATNATATKLTLVGAVGANFYPEDMTLDLATRQLYVESREAAGSGSDDVIRVFQLDAAGTTATLINTITPTPALSASDPTIGGMSFTQLVSLIVSGTSTSVTEQNSTATTLLTGSPTIADDGGYLKGATVQITAGTFSSNENSSADDHIGYGSGKAISGTVLGNISVSWNAGTGTFTLTGLDTIANYQSVLSQLVFWSTGDNPTNYGANTTRTLTWTLDDGTPGISAGAGVNSTTSVVTIGGVNDAPVNGTVSSATGTEATNIAVTGLQISDVDANPASQNMTVTLSVTKGVLTLRTDVASGLVSGDISGNGTGSVTITGTINKINATLAGSNGLVFLGNNGVSGTDTLTVLTSDGGGSGSGGAKSDTDNYTITIASVNDAPVATGATETLSATNEDVQDTTLANTVSSLFASHYSDTDADAFAGIAVTANGSSGSTGQWQYWNGSTWVAIGSASANASVLLSAGTALRFSPATDFNGAAPTLTARLVDASGGALTNGTLVNTNTSGGSTVYSAATVTLDHTVTAVNDAPTFTGGSSVSLTSIGEDSAPGAGQTVSALFSGRFSDAKDTVSGGSSANSLAGIAIRANAATAAQGVYQYFDGSTWHDLPAVSNTSAFLLDASTLLRFVPAADYFGTAPSLTVSMIEDSSGAVVTGTTADLLTSGTGGSTPYSSSMTLNIVVTATNDAPVATGSATLAAVDEDATNPAGATVSSLFGGNFSDADGDSLGGVAIIGNAATGQGVWQYSGNGGTSWTTINSPSLTSSILLSTSALLRFVPAANFNGSVPALTAHLIDSSGGAITTGTLTNTSATGGQTHYGSADVALTTTINAVNDAPSVPSTTGAAVATEQTATTLLPTLSVSDVDLDARNGGFGDYAGASFTVKRAIASADDSYAFDTAGASFTVSGGDIQVSGQTVATFTSTGGVLTINFTSSGAAATTSVVNDIIQHINYTNASDAPPASVTLQYALDDGGGQGSGGALSGSGSVVVTVTGTNDAHTGVASITGAEAEDQVLTAVSTLADADGIGTLHYQWQHDIGSGYVNVGTDQATYTLGDGDIGGNVRVVISYTDAGGTVESATSAATGAITASNDAPTGAVTVTGTTTEDQVLTADTSGLADSDGLVGVVFHYDWQRDTGSGFVSIGAADNVNYTLGDADVGATIRVVVSYTDQQNFANSVNGTPTATIAGINDPHTGGATITGTATEDQVLTADTSTLADVDGLGTLNYQWQHDVGSGYVNIGTNQATYTLGDADVGGTVRVVVSYTDGQGFSESATSAATAAVAGVNDAPTGAVTITGTATEDQVLTANTAALADVDGLGTLSYQWQRSNDSGGYDNVGTDQATYTLGDADVGKTFRVAVSYTDQQGFANSVNSTVSGTVAGVNDGHTGGVSITGTATEDQVLTAGSTLADVDGLGTLNYQWQRDTGSGFVNIGAATASTYTLGDADVGGTVRVVVSYTDGQGFSESATSAATAAVAGVNDAPTGAVTFTGTTTEDQVLTVDTSALADADGLGAFSYQWQRSNGSGGYDNVGTNATTYTLGDADVGKTIRVAVSYTDQQGFSNSVTSTASAAVAGVNDVHTGTVSITGTATEDQVLTAGSTLADVDGLGTLHYDWQRDTGSGFVSIGAADQATYTLGDSDVGATVHVVVSYTDQQGFAETATSAATATVANVNDLPTGTVTVSGSALPGQTLTAGNSLVDADGLGTISYQWKANGADIVGATGSTLALTDGDIGKSITVAASYTDLHGTAESVTSTAVTVDTNVPPPTTTTNVIDGAPVEVTKTTNPDGSVTQTTTISSVTPAATEQTADIPLFTENGQPLLSVSAPIGFSMTISGNDKPESPSSVLDNLVTAIRGVGGDNSQTGAGGDFLDTLTSDSRVLVQTVVPTVAPGAGTNIPLTFDGGPATDGVFTALVLDVSKLPSGTIINLNNIDFITIVGATQVGGGEGSQIVFGDNENQYIVLGADDDVLHGGGGNDTVGSKGGNDKIYGDSGDDTLFGGEGNDLMDGGTGNDTVLMGGNLKDYIFVHTSQGLTSVSFEGDDTMVNVETLKMVDGSTVTDLNKLVAGTTSVATMTYQFFTGKTPTGAGLEFLLHAPDTVNSNDLSDAYYTKFNVDNRYINFAINLSSPQGQGHAWFEANYGSLNYEQTVTKAYQEIFGVTLTTDKMQHLLYDQVGVNLTRVGYFEAFAGSTEGAKAGIIGWLLSAAVLENTGRYAAANTAFLNDFADGVAKLNVDLVGVYGDGHAWGT